MDVDNAMSEEPLTKGLPKTRNEDEAPHMNMGLESNPLSLNLNASDIDAMDDIVPSWESLCQNPITIKWPGVWEMNSALTEWEDIMVRVRNCWAIDPHMGVAKTNSNPMLWGMDIDMDKQVKFFGEYNPLVECLAKWLGSHTLTDHEARRKIPGSKSQHDTWLDVERGACQVEEATHRKKKKKRKVKGKNPFQNQFNPKTSKENSPLADSFNGEARRMIKVMRSKNKKLGKSIEFSQTFSPVKVIAPPLGFGEFKAAKEAKLEAIASRINETTENSALLNSIRAMKNSKLTKFLAKMNDDGVVCIDENMIEEETIVEDIPSKEAIPQVSYANMVSGKTPMALEDKIQFYPPLVNNDGTRFAVIDPKYIIQEKEEYKNVLYGYFIGCKFKPRAVTDMNDPCPENNVTQTTKRNDLPMGTNIQGDGFTLVRRRRGGTKPMDQGMRYKPAFTNLPKVHNLYQNREGNHHRETGRNSEWPRDGNDDQNINNKGDQGNSKEIEEQIGEENATTMNGTVTQTARSEAKETMDDTNLNRTRNREHGPRIKMVETSNSFHLLDQEGNELEEVNKDNAIKKNGEHTLHDKPDGWVRKQERTLTARFRDRLSQAQRLEAKRFVLDKLLPLDSTFSEWSPSLLEYFRHLCSIYNFGEGTVAAARERIHDLQKHRHESVEPMEEVESETDGMATMMNSNYPKVNMENMETPVEINDRSRPLPSDDIIGEGNTQATV
ncbi:hypothetical protein L1987_53904 [Smallanthus sonchifolius]|uniref:Uncharacterized protein n=1 Tax=Smallanthus sonchifolius TaxID=185202 RepID=A0ACB9E5R3_9ASTR|nr:hypothetical protein L1987_53904 [Smallanthus sonchifolius]